MSDIDEKKLTEKPGKRKRNADQRNRKSEQKRAPQAGQVRSAKAQIDAVRVASTDKAALGAEATRAQTVPIVIAAEPPARAAAETIAIIDQRLPVRAGAIDTTTVSADPVEAAVQHVTKAAAAETVPAVVTDVAEHSHVRMVTADALPVVALNVSQPPAAAMTSTDTAPIAASELEHQTVASTPTAIVPEAAPVTVAETPVSLRTIADAYGDYTRKSFEQTKCFFDKLTDVRSLDRAVEVQTEYARQAYETFVSQAQKIHHLHQELARQRFERFEGLMGTQTSRWM
jgi:hypothetical protein